MSYSFFLPVLPTSLSVSVVVRSYKASLCLLVCTGSPETPPNAPSVPFALQLFLFHALKLHLDKKFKISLGDVWGGIWLYCAQKWYDQFVN